MLNIKTVGWWKLQESEAAPGATCMGFRLNERRTNILKKNANSIRNKITGRNACKKTIEQVEVANVFAQKTIYNNEGDNMTVGQQVFSFVGLRSFKCFDPVVLHISQMHVRVFVKSSSLHCTHWV
jgi:hypothetical protein